MSPDPSALALNVTDLNEAIAFFTQRCGFRVEMILPADAPQMAVVSGQGMTLRLEAERANTADATPEQHTEHHREFIISRFDSTNAWHEGRAGMQYRDLIPGRLGGQFIASHIRIPNGGPVPDYVHYHKIRFQMIFCKTGWVRVVYEDQGPPFVLEAGDCVLQPPEIRHRVLEASPGLEVIEIGAPALHETWADHQLELPTKSLLPERLFNGQRFVRHCADKATRVPWRLEGFEARDTGIAAATNGLAAARVVKATLPVTASAQAHAGEFLFLFVLQGELSISSQVQEIHSLRTDDSCVIPAGVDYTLHADAELEMLEVSLPA
ncbi:MAG TPA: cupin domain-containing protein [Blastocatellia bacterium]|nr:cupin domain-containing protein [Blastocatellia bacterium]HMV84051.1 cupin domain-containing protein [Blastocatellia bacterium]HMY74719.1 cupin domain-containing protein [Blastocatellia bacterium]HMZ23222.1 cupin domain-containing protein [Blastocatellia bacterium]HNG34886.1 cupin domain-containing protein [Blastocatellia bacterium]